MTALTGRELFPQSAAELQDALEPIVALFDACTRSGVAIPDTAAHAVMVLAALAGAWRSNGANLPADPAAIALLYPKGLPT